MYYTKTQLKNRGWAEKKIMSLLGCPDATRRNPNYASAAPVQLFSIERVESLELSSDYKKSASRSAGANKAVESKTASILNYVESLVIEVPTYTEEQLIQAAVDSYNDFQDIRNRDKFATINSDKDFLLRITQNFIRHNLTSYEKNLEHLFGKVGKQYAYDRLNEKIKSAIILKYPWLAQCKIILKN